MVHGGQLGAWSFELLTRDLEQRGFDSIAIDLPIGDADAGADKYAAVVTDALAAVKTDVILVGHSMGGLVIPLVAQRRPVRRMVFVCAAYPEPGRSHFEMRANQPGEGVTAGPSSSWQTPGDFHMLAPEQARELFFHDCPPDVQDWAIRQMRRQCRRPMREITPLKEWPATPKTLVVTTDDRCIPRDSALRTAQRLFGMRPIELPGGHCPSLSRPEALAGVLVDLAHDA